MANDINRVFIIGRLTKDPELKYISSGTAVASMSIANNRIYVANGEKKEDVSFFNCIAWAKTGEIIAQYCRKGSQIAIDGRLQQKRWEDKEGKTQSAVEIVVDNIQFLSPRERGGDNNHENYTAGQAQSNTPHDIDFNDENIPF